jgi:hypothetical protein
MTRSDLLVALQHLPFGSKGGGITPIFIDRDVRDYLVARLKSR